VTILRLRWLVLTWAVLVGTPLEATTWKRPTNEHVVDPTGTTYVLLELIGETLDGRERVDMTIWEANPDLPKPENSRAPTVDDAPYHFQYRIDPAWRKAATRPGDRRIGRIVLPRMPWRTFVMPNRRGIVLLGHYGPGLSNRTDCDGMAVVSHDGRRKTWSSLASILELAPPAELDFEDPIARVSDGWIDDERGRLLILADVRDDQIANTYPGETHRVRLASVEVATGGRVSPRESVLSAIRAARARTAFDLFDVDLCREQKIPDEEFEALIRSTPEFDGVSVLSATILRERGRAQWNAAIEIWNNQDHRLSEDDHLEADGAAHQLLSKLDLRKRRTKPAP